MFASGEFGNYAAIFGVKFDLRGNNAGENDVVADDGDAGFIAGRFNRREQHARLTALGSDFGLGGKLAFEVVNRAI